MQCCNESESVCDTFFIQAGVRMSDIPELRRLCIRLSLFMRTGLDFFLDLSIVELMEIANEVNEIAGQHIYTGNKDSR